MPRFSPRLLCHLFSRGPGGDCGLGGDCGGVSGLGGGAGLGLAGLRGGLMALSCPPAFSHQASLIEY